MHFKNKRVLLALLGLVILFSFYAFSREVKHGFLKQADFDLTVKLQDRMPKRFDGLWEDFSFFVEPGPTIVLSGLLTIVALIDIRKKKIRLRALVIPILFGALMLGEMYGKTVVHHPAPPFFMIKHPATIFPTYYVNEQYSYPSGHTARAVFLGICLCSLFIIHNSIFKSKKLKLAVAFGIMCYILMVAIGHIYLGQHWLSDIIGGGLLGAGMGVLVLGLL